MMKLMLITKAINLLKLADVEYAVVMPDGAVVGNLVESLTPAAPAPVPAAAPAPVEEPKKRRRPRLRPTVRWSLQVPGYRQAIEAVPSGGNLTWKMADYDQAFRFQKCVASVANKAFGSGKFMTSADKDGTITMLRL